MRSFEVPDRMQPSKGVSAREAQGLAGWALEGVCVPTSAVEMITHPLEQSKD